MTSSARVFRHAGTVLLLALVAVRGRISRLVQSELRHGALQHEGHGQGT